MSPQWYRKERIHLPDGSVMVCEVITPYASTPCPICGRPMLCSGDVHCVEGCHHEPFKRVSYDGGTWKVEEE